MLEEFHRLRSARLWKERGKRLHAGPLRFQRISHSVIFNPDGSFTCKRRYEAPSSAEEFATDLKRIMSAARRGKIVIMEKTIEKVGPDSWNVVIRFKPLR